jgi:AbrB family looped-hinge helix DNA binding protein
MREERTRDHWKSLSGPRINDELCTRSRSVESAAKYEELLGTIEKTVVDGRGRIYIPKSIRNRLKIGAGDRLLIVPTNDRLEIRKLKSRERKLER